jgi:hypothetical protein
VQRYCKTGAALLQSTCSITAKHMQYYCKLYATSLQTISSNVATQLQYYITYYKAMQSKEARPV